MQPYVYWFLTALVLVALEIATGTFYILIIGIAFAIGGLAALAGFDLTLQIAFSAVAGVTGVILLQRKKRKTSPTDMNDPNVGEQVKVLTWGEGGKVRVSYRGSSWDAELASTEQPTEQALYIKEMRGSTLILSHQKP